MTPQQIRDAIAADPALQALAAQNATQAIAEALSVGRVRIVSRHVTERGVRALPVLPRSRHSLLTTLQAAATQTPSWLVPTLTALGIPSEDHAAYADDLGSAYRWLTNADGLDIGTAAARSMLDLIAASVPAAAAACAAVKALAEVPDPVTHEQVGAALRGDD